MGRLGKVLGVLLGGAVGISAVAQNRPAMPATPAPGPVAAPAMPARANLLDVVRPEFRDAVAKCVRQPTLATKVAGDDVVCTVAVYEWLLDHPDRVALAWQRLKVPIVTITDRGNGTFAWTDENGSEVMWQTVGTFADGRVWYGSGKVKAAAAVPTVPVQGVVILSHPKKAEKDGVAVFAPAVQCYMHSDSRAAALALRVLGPQGPKIAEDAAGQLLDFFGQVAGYVQNNPTKADALLAPKK
jgi:hypothetical protein